MIKNYSSAHVAVLHNWLFFCVPREPRQYWLAGELAYMGPRFLYKRGASMYLGKVIVLKVSLGELCWNSCFCNFHRSLRNLEKRHFHFPPFALAAALALLCSGMLPQQYLHVAVALVHVQQPSFPEQNIVWSFH